MHPTMLLFTSTARDDIHCPPPSKSEVRRRLLVAWMTFPIGRELTLILHHPLPCVLHHVSSTLHRTECTNHLFNLSGGDNGHQVRSQTIRAIMRSKTADLRAPRSAAPEPQHPHPFAPADLQKSFQDFLSKFKASSSASSSGTSQSTSSGGSSKHGENEQVFNDFWQAPEKLWKPQLSEAEIEAITVRNVYDTPRDQAHCFLPLERRCILDETIPGYPDSHCHTSVLTRYQPTIYRHQ